MEMVGIPSRSWQNNYNQKESRKEKPMPYTSQSNAVVE